MISRRNFVSGAGSALVIGCLSTSALAATSVAEGGVVDLSAGLTKESFQALLQQDFYVATKSSGVLVLQLAEVRDRSVEGGELPTESFTLYFHGLPSPRLKEGLYALDHGSAGQALLRLEPVKFTSTRAIYRAQLCQFS
jgi:hypothetical protein